MLSGHGADPAWSITVRSQVSTDAAKPWTVQGDTVQRAVGEGVREWWLPVEDGLEQGWTLEEPADGPSWTVHVDFDGATARVVAPDQVVLVQGARRVPYEGLEAWDTTGRVLPARFVAAAGGVDVEVDVRGAAYPVTVDPVFGSASWSWEPGADLAGLSLDALGDVDGDGHDDVGVAAPGASRLWVFAGGPDGLAADPMWLGAGEGPDFGHVFRGGDFDGDGYADLVASDGGGGELVVYSGAAAGLAESPGTTLVLDGRASELAVWDLQGDGYDDLVVGLSAMGGGLIQVHLGSVAGLVEEPAWLYVGDPLLRAPRLARAGDVGGDGFDDLIVGDEGYLLTFHGDGTAFDADPTLQLEGPFGSFVDGAGDLDGDGLADVVTTDGDRRVSVFRGTSSGVETLPWWQGAGTAAVGAGDVDGDGLDDLLVSDRRATGFTNRVRANLYFGDAVDLGVQADWSTLDHGDTDCTELDGPAMAGLGDIDGDDYDDLMLGEPCNGVAHYVSGAAGGPGGVSVQRLLDTSWTFEDYAGFNMVPFDDADGDGDGELVTVTVTGVLEHFAGSPDGFLGEPVESDDGPGFESFGVGLASGDLDGDGLPDLVVTKNNPPTALVHYRDADGTLGLSSPDLTLSLPSGGGGSYSRWPLVSIGDLDADGDDDLVVASSEASNSYLAVFLGDPAGVASSPSVMIEGTFLGNDLGVDDFDGDGFDDVFVTRLGDALVFPGSAAGLATVPSWTVSSFGQWDIGSSVGPVSEAVGDVNGDGFGDVLLSYMNQNFVDAQCLLHLGSAAGLDPVFAVSLVDPPGTNRICSHVAPAGDVNGDGYDDVLLKDDWGYSALHLGSATGLETDPIWSMTAGSSDEAPLMKPYGVGDIDGDGFHDIARPFNFGLMVLYGNETGVPKPLVARPGGPYVEATSDVATVLDGSGSLGVPPLQYAWDCDDDGVFEASGALIECSFAEAGIYAVSLQITDAGGAVDEAMTDVFVDLPVLTLADAEGDEGSVIEVVGTIERGEDAVLTGDCGDGSGAMPLVDPIVVCTYEDDGTYTVRLEATSDPHVVFEEATVEVSNLAPSIVWGPETGLEGSPIVLDIVVEDPGAADTVDVVVDCAPLEADAGTSVGEGTCLFPQDGFYLVRVTATDDDGAETVVEEEVSVANVAPVVDAGQPVQVELGGSVSFVGTFDDPGVLDTHAVSWDFGDGSGSADLMTAHAYDEPGTYVATLTVDDGVDTTVAERAVTVVSPESGAGGASSDGPKEGCGCLSGGPPVHGLWMLTVLPWLRRRGGARR